MKPGLGICADHEELLEFMVRFGQLDALLLPEHK